jgi:hypothetical protein
MLTLLFDIASLMAPEYDYAKKDIVWKLNYHIEFFLQELSTQLPSVALEAENCQFILIGQFSQDGRIGATISRVQKKLLPCAELETLLREALEEVDASEFPFLARFKDISLTNFKDQLDDKTPSGKLLVSSDANLVDWFNRRKLGKAIHTPVGHDMVKAHQESVLATLKQQQNAVIEVHLDLDETVLPTNELASDAETPLNQAVINLCQTLKEHAQQTDSSLSFHICTARASWINHLRENFIKLCVANIPTDCNNKNASMFIKSLEQRCQQINGFDQATITQQLRKISNDFQLLFPNDTDVALPDEIIQALVEPHFFQTSTPVLCQQFMAATELTLLPMHIIQTGSAGAKGQEILKAVEQRQKTTHANAPQIITILVDNSMSELKKYHELETQFHLNGITALSIRVLEPGDYEPESVFEAAEFCKLYCEQLVEVKADAIADQENAGPRPRASSLVNHGHFKPMAVLDNTIGHLQALVRVEVVSALAPQGKCE